MCLVVVSISYRMFLLFTVLIVISSFKNGRYSFRIPAPFRQLFSLEMSTLEVETTTDGIKIGHAHSDESKAKISAGNKGKTPWNQGKKHSEETRQRIAEKTKLAALQKKQLFASQLGFTLEEYDVYRKNQTKIKQQIMKGLLIATEDGTIIPSPNATTLKGGLTEAGRKRISDSIKARWQNEEYRKKYTIQKGRTVSVETRQRISEALKLKWLDNDYRSKCVSTNVSAEQREKISTTLKNKWLNDIEFKTKMSLILSHQRTEEWKASVSQKMKDMWTDPTYRNKVLEGYRNTTKPPRNYSKRVKKQTYVFKSGAVVDFDKKFFEVDRVGAMSASSGSSHSSSSSHGSSSMLSPYAFSNDTSVMSSSFTNSIPSSLSSSSSFTPHDTSSLIPRFIGGTATAAPGTGDSQNLITIEQRKINDKNQRRHRVITRAKLELQQSSSGHTRSIRRMIGEEFWLEEKVKHSIRGQKMIDDNSLELILLNEWLREHSADSNENDRDLVGLFSRNDEKRNEVKSRSSHYEYDFSTSSSLSPSSSSSSIETDEGVNLSQPMNAINSNPYAYNGSPPSMYSSASDDFDFPSSSSFTSSFSSPSSAVELSAGSGMQRKAVKSSGTSVKKTRSVEASYFRSNNDDDDDDDDADSLTDAIEFVGGRGSVVSPSDYERMRR